LVRDETDFFRPLDFETILSREDTQQWFDIINADFFGRFLSGQLTKEECRYIGFREQTSRMELIKRTVLEVAGTVLTGQLAVRCGIASNTAGGTHHAHMTMGSGYTILNDLAVTTRVLTRQYPETVRRVLVVDCDVHQGDGTAKFHASSDLPLHGKLFTLSLHCASNYPTLKANSTIDVGLPDGMEDEAYLQILESTLERAVGQIQPDFVLYDAGVDVYANDRLGRLKLSEMGIRLRDRLVLDYCVTNGIPVATVVGGGYDRDVDALARRHALVIEEAAYVWRKHNLWKRLAHPRKDHASAEDG
jgi:acetoin utilization deacetylase AcuC-like enzyme